MCKKIFLNYILAGYPVLWIETHEEYRALLTMIDEVSKAKDHYYIYTWDRVDGIKLKEIKNGVLNTGNLEDDTVPLNDPAIALQWADNQMPDNSVLLLQDFHHYLKDNDDVIIRKIRNIIPKFKATGKVLAILSHTVSIPSDIEKEVTVISFKLPSTDELRLILKGACESAEFEYPKNDESIIEAARGMTFFEAENAFSLSLVEKGEFNVSLINREKASIVKKTGLLEVLEVNDTINDIGGLDILKGWLTNRSKCFSEDARKFGIKPPRGLLLVGVPGTGKSLTAKVTASILNRPLLRLDVGKIFGAYVGESESNVHKCLNIAEAVAPCCLFIDEFEKFFSLKSDSHDTSKHVFSIFLTWLQEKTADVFIVATANNVDEIPSAMLRSGRFDKLFWVDLPNNEQRAEIINIHLSKVNRESKNFDMVKLVEASKNFTGAEIKTWIEEALVYSFNKGNELNTQDLVEVSKVIIPIAQLTADEINKSRQWAIDRGIINASSNIKPVQIETLKKRKISLK